jgi:hypothetical protein
MKLLFAKFPFSPGKALFATSLACLIVVVICAAEKTEPVENDQQLKNLQEKFEKAQATIDELQEENASLRRENQELRRMFAETIESSSNKALLNPVAPPGPRGSSATYQSDDVRTNPPGTDDAALTHWLSTAGKRHNSSCRYFKKAEGQLCGPNDGIACTLCGG